jgi:hypothetical protein
MNKIPSILKESRRFRAKAKANARQVEGHILREGIQSFCEEQGWNDLSLLNIFEAFVFEHGLTLELLEYMRKCQKQENGDDSKEDGINPES